MKKILYGVVGTVGLLVGLLLTAPFFINVNDYQSDIENYFYKKTHRTLSVDALSLRLLPIPSLLLKGVKISNMKGGTVPFMVTVDTAKITVDLLALCQKQLKLSHISLIQPVVNLEKIQDKPNWDLNLKSEPLKAASVSSSTDSTPIDMMVNRVEIIRGAFNYKDKTTQINLNDITSTLQMDDFKGPFKAHGYVKVKEHDLNFDVFIKYLADDLPIKASIDMTGIEGTLDGKFSLKSNVFKGDIEAKTHGDTLEKFIKNESMAPFLKEPMTVRTYVMASSESIDLQNIEIDYDKQKITGLMQVFLTPFKMTMDLRGFTGGTAVSLALSPNRNDSRGTLILDSSNPKKFLKWLGAPVDFIHEDLSSRLHLTTDVLFKKESVFLEKWMLKYREASLKGHMAYHQDKATFVYDMALHTSPQLMKALNIEPNLGVLNLKGQTILKENIETQTTLGILGFVIDLKGSLGSFLNPSFNMFLKITAKSLSALCQAIDYHDLPLKNFHLSTTLSGPLDVIEFKKLEAALNFKNNIIPMTGDFVLTTSPKPTLKGSLTLDTLHELKKVSKPIIPASLDVSTPTSTPLPASSSWSTTPFNFDYLNKFNMDVDILIKGLRFYDVQLHDFKTKVSLLNGMASLLDTTAKVMEGDFKLEAALQQGANPHLKIISSLTKINPKHLPVSFKITDGTVDASLNISSTGHTLQNWMENLKGRLIMQGIDTTIQGFDVENLSNKLKKVNHIESLLGLLSSLDKGETVFSKITAECDIKKGIGTLKNCRLETKGGLGKLKGVIDFPHYSLNAVGSLYLTDHSLPPLTINIMGPLDNITYQWDSKAFQRAITATLLQDKGVKNSLKGFMGFLSSKNESKATPSETKKQEAAKENSKEPSKDIKKDDTLKELKSLVKDLF